MRLVLFVGLVVGISLPSYAQTVVVIYKQELRLEIWKGGNRTQQYSICSLFPSWQEEGSGRPAGA